MGPHSEEELIGPDDSSSLSPEEIRLVDSVCDRFETAYKSGSQPNLVEYLDGISQAVLPTLLEELLQLDRAYQARMRTTPVRQDEEHSPFRPHSPDSSSALKPPSEEDVPREALPGGDYLPLTRIGRGGMGEVYLARRCSTSELVILKVIRQDRLDELSDERRQEWIRRFRTEGAITQGLEHPHIVTIFTVGDFEGQPFLAMQYIGGQNLGDLLKEGPLAPDKAVSLLETIARAVHHAHKQGVLHRDLKPRNILLDSVGRPFVTDFGLAKWVLEGEEQLTMSGDMLGSPPYMSPEQMENSSTVTVAADIYSLGATLYHMLTGRPPFLALTIPEMINQVLHDDPVPPRKLQPTLSRDLDTICLKCLDKTPGKRYTTVEELADDLRRFANNEPILARPLSLTERTRRWAQRHPAWATACSIGLIAIMCVLSVWVSYYYSLLHAYDKVEKEKNVAHSRLRTAQITFDQALDAFDQMGRDLSAMRLPESAHWQTQQRVLLTKTLGFYQNFVAERGDDPALREQASRAALRLGEIYTFLGNYTEADRAFDRAETLTRALTKHQSQDSEFHRRLAHCKLGRGVLYIRKGHPKEAMGYLLRARTLLDKILATKPATEVVLQDQGQTEYFLGAALAKLDGGREDALAAYTKARTIQADLRKRHPESIEYARDEARTSNNLSILLRSHGDLAEAEKQLRLAQGIDRELVAQHPQDPFALETLARATVNLAVVRVNRGDMKVQPLLDEGIERFRKLTEDYPLAPRFLRELADSYQVQGWYQATLARSKDFGPEPATPKQRWARIDEMRKVYEDAEKSYRTGLTLATKLVAEFPKNPENRHKLALIEVGLADVLADTARHEEALVLLRDAEDLQTALIDESEDVPDRENDLGTTCYYLCETYWELGLQTDPYALYREVAARSLLVSPLMSNLTLLKQPAYFALARSYSQQAIEHHELAVAGDPRNRDYIHNLNNDHTLAAQMDLSIGDHASAYRHADFVVSERTQDFRDLLRAANVLADCVPAIERDPTLLPAQKKEVEEKCIGEAMTALDMAIDRGFSDEQRLRDWGRAYHLDKRPEFTKLAMKIREKKSRGS